MELQTYAGVVEENYQRLADLLLSSDPDASKVQRLLSIDLLPTPPIKRGYAIWSEGLLAEAFACFPTPARPERDLLYLPSRSPLARSRPSGL